MDFWASLEHELAYKLAGQVTEAAAAELKACAEVIADTDRRMQSLYNMTIRPSTQSGNHDAGPSRDSPRSGFGETRPELGESRDRAAAGRLAEAQKRTP